MLRLAFFFVAASSAVALDDVSVRADGSVTLNSKKKKSKSAAAREDDREWEARRGRESPLLAEGEALPAEPLSQAEIDFILPPGRIIVFPKDTKVRSLALAPRQGGLIVVDGALHGDRRKMAQFAPQGWFARLKSALFSARAAPYPSAYLVSSRGAVRRNMEFPDAGALPLGAAESPAAQVAFLFYQGKPGIEVWEAPLTSKVTFHDVGVKPALGAYDTDGLLWVPCTIADRLNEEGDKAVVLFAYRADGSRWEAFARRQMASVRFPHALRIESGLLAVAGLREWAFQDGVYGPELKAELDAHASFTAIDFYALSHDVASEHYAREQETRYAERANIQRDALSAPQRAAARRELLTTDIALRATYDFPFALCLWPLMALMGDGHAVTACWGQPGMRVLRYGDPSREAVETPPGTKVMADALAPRAPAGFASVALRDAADARVVADYAAPWDVGSIVSLHADPSGAALIVADAKNNVVFSVPWPFPGLEADAAPPKVALTAPPPLPGEKKFTIEAIPRST
jgi:hypothetical protein